jgi:hypothetical protein
VNRWAVPATAAVLAALLVAGGAAAVASRSGGGFAPRAAPRPVPTEGAGPSVVELSADAARHPDAEAVRAQLQRHYNAINVRDYASWRDTVVPARANALPESAWREAYATTRDGTIRIHRIDRAGDGALLVRVHFVSTQAREDAPDDVPAERICWRSTLPMTGAPPRIDMTGGGSSQAEAC